MEVQYTIILIACLILFSVAFFGVGWLISNRIKDYLTYKYEALSVEKYKTDVSLNLSDDIEKRLDQLIDSCFQEYSLLNLAWKTKDWYIKEKDEIKITKELGHMVMERISPTMMRQMSLYYNEDTITDIISKRVYFKVTQYVIDHNKQEV